jgi:hypothetical protein
MSTKRTLVVAILFVALTSLCGLPTPAHAGVHVNFGVRVGAPPPPFRHERILVRPGPGYLWVPGFWDWRASNYVWVPGYWARPPHRGAVWVAPRYVHRHRYHYYRHGYWR